MRKLTVIAIIFFSTAQLMTLLHQAVQVNHIDGLTNRVEVLENQLGE
jgi:hypothetical protein